MSKAKRTYLLDSPDLRGIISEVIKKPKGIPAGISISANPLNTRADRDFFTNKENCPLTIQNIMNSFI